MSGPGICTPFSSSSALFCFFYSSFCRTCPRCRFVKARQTKALLRSGMCLCASCVCVYLCLLFVSSSRRTPAAVLHEHFQVHRCGDEELLLGCPSLKPQRRHIHQEGLGILQQETSCDYECQQTTNAEKLGKWQKALLSSVGNFSVHGATRKTRLKIRVTQKTRVVLTLDPRSS